MGDAKSKSRSSKGERPPAGSERDSRLGQLGNRSLRRDYFESIKEIFVRLGDGPHDAGKRAAGLVNAFMALAFAIQDDKHTLINLSRIGQDAANPATLDDETIEEVAKLFKNATIDFD